MMFIFRAAFWLSVVILLLPGDPEAGAEAPRVTLVEALGAARATVDDLSRFCVRNPDVCATGEAVVEVMADKARYGFEQIQGYLDRATIEAEAEGTLTPDDIDEPWQEPGLPDDRVASAGT